MKAAVMVIAPILFAVAVAANPADVWKAILIVALPMLLGAAILPAGADLARRGEPGWGGGA